MAFKDKAELRAFLERRRDHYLTCRLRLGVGNPPPALRSMLEHSKKSSHAFLTASFAC